MTKPTLRPVPLAAAVLTATALVTACRGPYPPPPGTAREPVVDTIHGIEFIDDYRWLEEQYSPATRAWIAEQNAYAQRIVGDTATRAELAARLRELMDVPGAIFPRRAGDYEYFSMRRPGREVAAIYRRPVPAERQYAPIDPEGDFEVVVDPLDIHPDGTTGASIRDFSPDGALMLYAIRDGGRDEVSIRVRDLATGEDLPDRLRNPSTAGYRSMRMQAASTTSAGRGRRGGGYGCACWAPMRPKTWSCSARGTDRNGSWGSRRGWTAGTWSTPCITGGRVRTCTCRTFGQVASRARSSSGPRRVSRSASSGENSSC